jgi:RNA polymerase sigma factor (sigma-70 family)
MPPPPAEPFAARVFLGPALRAQPDRRLVKLVREGYEAAFEEIVRRYRRPLDRFAAAIVGGRSEDVTQDAFSKALLALRGTTTEIELKPWLYRIVRNTALNDLRDGAPATEELSEAVPGGRSAAEVAESREEIGELMERLRALPEPQRAAIVMRELEGLSHEEIAAALGVSGGAARQAIYRGRMALRDGVGLLIPLPLLRVLFDHGAEAAGAGAGGVAAAGVASAAGGGTGATLGGLGAAGALKVGLATAVLAGSVGAGVAMQHDRGGHGAPAPATAERPVSGRASAESVSFREQGEPGRAPAVSSGERRGGNGPERGEDRGGGEGSDDRRGDRHGGDGEHRGHGGEIAGGVDDHGGGSGGPSGRGGGSGHREHSGSGEDSGGHSGEEVSGGSRSGRHLSGGDSGSGSGSGDSGSGGHGGDSGGHDSGGSNSSDSGSGGSGGGGPGSSNDPAVPAIAPAAGPSAPESGGDSVNDSSGDGGGSDSSGDSGSGGSGGGSVDS